jgi:hypothetical protein
VIFIQNQEGESCSASTMLWMGPGRTFLRPADFINELQRGKLLVQCSGWLMYVCCFLIKKS